MSITRMRQVAKAQSQNQPQLRSLHSHGFPAAITQHIPDKGAQMVRYYGWYSNKMRGQRHRAQMAARLHRPCPPGTPPPPAKLPSKKWRDLIMQVWHTDPLICPQCQH